MNTLNKTNMVPVYNIIKDYTELERFVSQLPDLGEEYKYYISLFARKKYGGTEGLTADKCQLKRCVASKGKIISKLRQMEIPLGAYTFESKGGGQVITVNQESLVVYISVNPRDMRRAAGELCKTLISKIVSGQPIKNPQSEALNHIQKYGKKLWFNVDIDFSLRQEVDKQSLERWLNDKVNPEAYRLVRTRGGYHILVNLKELTHEYKKSWYINIKKSEELPIEVDLSNGDGMMPIPGCVQAEFIPRML